MFSIDVIPLRDGNYELVIYQGKKELGRRKTSRGWSHDGLQWKLHCLGDAIEAQMVRIGAEAMYEDQEEEANSQIVG